MLGLKIFINFTVVKSLRIIMIVKIETAYKIGNIVIQAKINPSKSPFCIQRHHHSNHQINQVYVPDLYSTNIRDNGLYSYVSLFILKIT